MKLTKIYTDGSIKEEIINKIIFNELREMLKHIESEVIYVFTEVK